MSVILVSVLVLGMIGAAGALLLNLVARKFRVEEDGRVDEVEKLLPGANCGACGYKGCRDFAKSCVEAGSMSGFDCPGAGEDGMRRISRFLGFDAVGVKSRIAVLRCAGSCDVRAGIMKYDGVRSCAVMAMSGSGERGCLYGCLGCGDCADACSWNAIRVDVVTGLPEIDPDACTGCGLCASVCPRGLIELRDRNPLGRLVWVACSSKDRGAVARKDCGSACIGCGRCARTCPFGAIEVSDNLAHVDNDKCKSCGKCVEVCPMNVIFSCNLSFK